MEYICNTIEEAVRAMNRAHNAEDIFICSNEVFEYICNQPERSKREDTKKIEWPLEVANEKNDIKRFEYKLADHLRKSFHLD
jgi:hypothetical protein